MYVSHTLGPLGKGCSLQKGLAFISITRVTPRVVGRAEGEISAFSTCVKEWEGTGYIQKLRYLPLIYVII